MEGDQNKVGKKEMLRAKVKESRIEYKDEVKKRLKEDN